MVWKTPVNCYQATVVNVCPSLSRLHVAFRGYSNLACYILSLPALYVSREIISPELNFEGLAFYP